MEMTDAKVVEKKIYEEGKEKKKEYASKGIAGTGLGLGIAGTALGLGAWLLGSRSPFGSLGGGNMPDNVNINANGVGAGSNQPSALQVLEKENADEVALLEKMYGLKLDTANKFYAMRETDVAEKFGLFKGSVEALNAENRRAERAEFGLYKSQIEGDFGLYKAGRDQYDAANAKISALETKIAVLEATAPYKEKIIMQAIEMMGERGVNYTDRKTCRCIYGVVGLPSTPTTTVLEGASPFGCNCARNATTPTTGA